MKLVTSEQMRELDRRTIAEFAIPGEQLMERAGAGVASVVRRLARWRGDAAARVRLAAGRGNNGGDAFVAARHLREAGFDVEVWLAAGAGDLKGDALTHFRRMAGQQVRVREMPEEADWQLERAPHAGPAILVDGLLGTGRNGAAQGVMAAAIRLVNAASKRSPVVAIDVPSGLDADTGIPEGETVRADVTATMGLPKRGLVEAAALDYVGNLEVVDIGLPAILVGPLPDDRELIVADEVAPLLKRRQRASHKGDYGHVLIIGGARGYAGAAALAARAAVRSGCGLVSVLAPASVAPVIAAVAPEAMVHFGEETREGSLAVDCLSSWQRSLRQFDAVVAGPGMTLHAQTRLLVERILREVQSPLVMDADALNVVGRDLALIKRCRTPVIVTPHPGEMGRLVGCSAAAVQSDRPGAVRTAVEATGATVVLKGAGTLVGHVRQIRVNMTGNPGMAKGGMGDVLAGLIGGLLAQGLSAPDAAALGVFLHGRAADIASWRSSQPGIAAGDVIDALSLAWRELSSR